MIDDIIQAIRREKRTLAVVFGAYGPRFDRCANGSVLRVEIARDAFEPLWESLRPHQSYAISIADVLAGRRDGPMTVEGVALYRVNKLPAPGWRVVNPLVGE